MGNRFRRASFVAALSVAVSLSASETALGAGAELGGVDLSAYCQSLGYDAAVVEGSPTGPNAAFNWRCADGPSRYSLDVTAACRRQYNDAAAVAGAQNLDDAYSWRCYRGAVDGAPTPANPRNLSSTKAQKYAGYILNKRFKFHRASKRILKCGKRLSFYARRCRASWRLPNQQFYGRITITNGDGLFYHHYNIVRLKIACLESGSSFKACSVRYEN